MTPIEIYTAGWTGKEIPDLTPSETTLWLRAALMRYQYEAGEISKEQGIEMKKAAIAEYSKQSTKETMTARILMEQALRYVQMEPLIDSFRTQPTIEKANAVIDLFYGFIPKGVTPNE